MSIIPPDDAEDAPLPVPPKTEPCGPGQESVWDYPRPPRLAPSTRHVRVEYADTIIAESTSAIRLLETSHPPTWYLPPQDVRTELLRPAPGRSRCEWKGAASYWDLAVGDRVCAQAAWSYSTPGSHFTAIAGFVAFYPGRVDVCYVDGERVRAQPGEFYGGWVTDDVSGPFKGEAGTLGW